MTDSAFFAAPEPLTIRQILALTSVDLADGEADLDRLIDGVAPVDTAGPSDICYAAGKKYLAMAESTKAGACFCTPANVDHVSRNAVRLVTSEPQLALAMVAQKLYPSAVRPTAVTTEDGVSAQAFVDPSARIAGDARIEPSAVIGPGAEIGARSIVGPNAVVGPMVRIGEDSRIGPGVTVLNALIGDRVILHPGVRIGQDGYGFIPTKTEHLKVPQIGRVVIGDDVEIGANTAIDRGSSHDTEIGDGTKIDNLVQIGHNVSIGRGCLIVAQVGISGSTTIEDFVVIGGQCGINGHLRIGKGAQIAAASTVYGDVPPGAKWGGAPARPLRDWLRAQSRDLAGGRVALRGRRMGGASEDGDA